MNIWHTIRTHPKKTIFATCLASYSANYATDQYHESSLRRKLCSIVKPLGQQPINPTGQLHRLTVFVNPFARRGKILKTFDKNVAPFLHLAGLDVQMVYVDTDNEVKDYLKVIDPNSTDGVVIVSDDHLLQKAVTSLIQRSDYWNTRLCTLPVGVVPVGLWNSFASQRQLKQPGLEWCYESIHNILYSKTKTVNLLEISTLNTSTTTDNQQQEQTVIHSLSGLDWSIWRDAEHGGGLGAPKRRRQPINTNDHPGPLQPISPHSPRSWFDNFRAGIRHAWYWARSDSDDGHASFSPSVAKALSSDFFRRSSDLESSSSASRRRRQRVKRGRLAYQPYCSGCSRCWPDRCEEEARLQSHRDSNLPLVSPPPTTATKPTPSRFGRLLGLSSSSQQHHLRQPVKPDNGDDETKSSTPEPASSQDNNEQSIDKSLVDNPECGSVRQLELTDCSSLSLVLDDDHIHLELIPTPTNLFDHLWRSFAWIRAPAYAPKLPPNQSLSNAVNLDCSCVELHPEDNDNEFFWIDNDHFEARPVKIRVRRNMVPIFE